MANPTPTALHDAATALRTQAQAAQQALDARDRQRENDNTPAVEKATQRLDAAEAAVKSAQSHADSAWEQHNDLREQAHKLQAEAQQAAQHGDGAKAADLNRRAANASLGADDAEARYRRSTDDVNTANSELDEARRGVTGPVSELQSRMVDPHDAEVQLDLMKQKADLLDQAGRKLELAPTIDNPVERATLELDAEKLIRGAGGIQIMTNEITKATGQEMQLPDTDHLATDDTSTNDTDLMDPFADATAPDADTVPTAGAPDDANDVAGAAAPDDALATAAASTDDPLGASPGDATATTATATATLEPTASETSGFADPSDVALGDPGGVDVAAATPPFDAPTIADAGASDFAADPAADAGGDPSDSSDDAGF